ncbi:ChaN family lipoprotein [Pseudocolwellia sp. HL-MZ19]|uniref:ChaN family lipoprotein n=1 Tax=unclassified Pseudocolwellia TaxID=2848178 RepID=UPI003CF2EA19
MNKINTDVNYRTMAGNARLLMIGESSHNAAMYKYEAIKALKQLKAAGFTHFAMEMLPKTMQEQIDLYQRTGKGFPVIQQYFDENWKWGYGVPEGYGDLIRAAKNIGLKVIALDLTIEQMKVFDLACDWDDAVLKKCESTHFKRNKVWAENIDGILKSSQQNKIIAFMHRWHAIEAAKYEPGLDTLLQKKGISKIRFIDLIGGNACSTKRSCKGYSDEINELKKQYFSREGIPYKSAVKTYQVHIPERSLNIDGAVK